MKAAGPVTHGEANADEDFLLALQYGMTTVTQQCECGLERSYTVAGEIGDVTPTPEEG